MKVKELIKLLESMPQDAETMIEYTGYYEAEIEMVQPYIEVVKYYNGTVNSNGQCDGDGSYNNVEKVVIASVDANP